MAFLWQKKGDLLLQEGPYFTGRSAPLGPHNTRSLGPRGPIPLVDWGLGGPSFGGAHLHMTPVSLLTLLWWVASLAASQWVCISPHSLLSLGLSPWDVHVLQPTPLTQSTRARYLSSLNVDKWVRARYVPKLLFGNNSKNQFVSNLRRIVILPRIGPAL